MANFACGLCGHEGHYVEFKTGSHEVFDSEIEELIEVDELECPECGNPEPYET